jgi:hypothetical protein
LTGASIKNFLLVGVALLLLAAPSFVVRIPHRENHRATIGDAKLGVQQETGGKRCRSNKVCLARLASVIRLSDADLIRRF